MYNKIIAPITDIIICPIKPPKPIPKISNNPFPIIPPRTPITRFHINPIPPPRINNPARYPDSAPIKIDQMNDIALSLIS